jgi:hypothetical protein
LHEGILPVGWEKGKVYTGDEIKELLKDRDNPDSEMSELDRLFKPSRMIGDDHNAELILTKQHAVLRNAGIVDTGGIVSLLSCIATYADLLRKQECMDANFTYNGRIYQLTQKEIALPNLSKVLGYTHNEGQNTQIITIRELKEQGQNMKISFIPESIPLIKALGFFMGPNIKTDAILDDVNPYHLNPVRLLILFPHLTNHGEQGPKA